MNQTILAVDDDPALLHALQMILESSGYAVAPANSGGEALRILEAQPIALIVADVAMPQMNGYQLFAQVMANPGWTDIPFIFLSARNLDSDVQFGKELGVDDYLIKPVRSADLLASIRGKLKRSQWRGRRNGAAANRPVVQPEAPRQFGPLKIATRQHRVWMEDRPVPLSAREFKLLDCIAGQPGCVVTHQALVQATHNLDTDAGDASRLLRPLVRSLRRKLGYQAGEMGCIENVRGEGYLFVLPPQRRTGE